MYIYTNSYTNVVKDFLRKEKIYKTFFQSHNCNLHNSPVNIWQGCVYVCVCVCARARARICAHAQSHLTLCDPTDCSPLGSSVHGILQERIREWGALPFSRESS